MELRCVGILEASIYIAVAFIRLERLFFERIGLLLWRIRDHRLVRVVDLFELAVKDSVNRYHFDFLEFFANAVDQVSTFPGKGLVPLI